MNNKELLGRLKAKRAGGLTAVKSLEEQLFDIHYLFCRKFGWISPAEFFDLSPSFINDTVKRINEEIRNEQKQYRKVKKNGR